MKKRYDCKKKFHYFYEIRNNINNHFYYGIHSTDDMEDGYMGSGKRLNYAYKKYGIENFTKTILKEFSTREEASQYEAEIVTETLVKDDNCYNCTLGGDMVASTLGKVVCQDKESGEWVIIPQEDYYNNKEKYIQQSIGKVIAKNQQGDCLVLDKEEYFKGKEKGLYCTHTTNKIVVKDKNGKTFIIEKTDPRYINGELTMFWSGKKHSEESKKKMSQSHKGKHIGSNNNNYGKCWITKSGENKTILKEDLEKWIADGWIKGRCVLDKKYEKVSKLNKNEILELRDSDMKWKDIAKKIGISQTTIFEFKKQNEIYEKKKYSELTNDKIEEIKKLREQDKKWTEISKILNTNIWNLSQFRKKHNLD